jgi:hypothetical protein
MYTSTYVVYYKKNKNGFVVVCSLEKVKLNWIGGCLCLHRL